MSRITESLYRVNGVELSEGSNRGSKSIRRKRNKSINESKKLMEGMYDDHTDYNNPIISHLDPNKIKASFEESIKTEFDNFCYSLSPEDFTVSVSNNNHIINVSVRPLIYKFGIESNKGYKEAVTQRIDSEGNELGGYDGYFSITYDPEELLG